MVSKSVTNGGVGVVSRAARLLEVLIRLSARPRFTAQELADEFGVSRRTMLRDLHELSAMGVPLAATPGPGGGYALARSGRILPLALTRDEAIGIVLSYEAFLQYAQSPFAAQSLSAITKLRAALPPDVVRDLDRIRRYVAIVGTERRYEAPLLPDLLRAALDGAHLRVVYDSRSGVSERVIAPLGLYAADGFWYCACYDERRRGLLALRADRIAAAEPVAGHETPPLPDLRDWLRARETNPPDPLPFRATVTRRGMRSFELATLFEPLAAGDDGGVIAAAIPASEVEYFAARLLPLGADLVVESPPQLIAALRRLAREILERYPAAGEGR